MRTRPDYVQTSLWSQAAKTLANRLPDADCSVPGVLKVAVRDRLAMAVCGWRQLVPLESPGSEYSRTLRRLREFIDRSEPLREVGFALSDDRSIWVMLVRPTGHEVDWELLGRCLLALTRGA